MSALKRGTVGSPQMNNYTRDKSGPKPINVDSIKTKYKFESGSSLQKKQDRAVLQMPRNTLLEPANVVAAWGDQNEEAKEVSVTLKAMRQKYDKIHQVVLSKQEELDNLKR